MNKKRIANFVVASALILNSVALNSSLFMARAANEYQNVTSPFLSGNIVKLLTQPNAAALTDISVSINMQDNTMSATFTNLPAGDVEYFAVLKDKVNGTISAADISKTTGECNLSANYYDDMMKLEVYKKFNGFDEYPRNKIGETKFTAFRDTAMLQSRSNAAQQKATILDGSGNELYPAGSGDSDYYVISYNSLTPNYYTFRLSGSKVSGQNKIGVLVANGVADKNRIFTACQWNPTVPNANPTGTYFPGNRYLLNVYIPSSITKCELHIYDDALQEDKFVCKIPLEINRIYS